MTAAEKAAYRALAAYRMNATQRQHAAQKVVAVLAEMPTDLLRDVAPLGESSGVVGDLVPAMYPVTMHRRREAAAAAIAAAVEVLCSGNES